MASNSFNRSRLLTSFTEKSEPEESDDPFKLMNEFRCLYSEKIKRIEDKGENPTQAKLKVLEEWVNDLTAQNYALIQTVNALEKEALERVKVIDQLSSQAKTFKYNQDELVDCGSQVTDPFTDCQIKELQNSLHENEVNLKAYTIEMENLSAKLEEKNKECETLHRQNCWLVELQKRMKQLECDLQQKTELVASLQEQNHDVTVGEHALQAKIDDLTLKIEDLSSQLQSKDSIIDGLKKCIQEKESNQDSDPVRCSLLVELKEKEKEISNLKKNNEKDAALLDKQRQQVDVLSAENCKLQEKLNSIKRKMQALLNREVEFKNEICQLKNSEEQANLRVKEMESYICELEGQIQEANNVGDNSSYQESEDVRELMKALSEKQCEIERHEAERERLYSEINMLEQTYKKREEHMVAACNKLSCQLKMKEEEIYMLSCERPQCDQDIGLKPTIAPNSKRYKGNSEIEKLQFKMKDLQKALTGEIADKHDEIRRLKDDIKELEDKLRQSEKQTHFRDDLIKELRKEVKLGRAKESLAEMLGLKGTPRAEMKDEIDNLTSQLEELKAHNLALETRLAECNLPAVLTLRSKLNQAEGSLLAMCNKIDYVRRYLENLKGDEEMSLKCGIEALLNELRDDVEWNRQTRRNLSLDEGTSVIVITHRSRSLPDNSLHRMPSKSQSDSAVSVFNKSLSNNAHFPMLQESFLDCKNYIQNINELENNFDETNKEISCTWSSLKMWSQGSGDNLLKSFQDIIRSSVEGNEELARLATQVESLLDNKEINDENPNLDYLEENLIELGRQLAKANLMAPSSVSDINHDTEKNDEVGELSKKISMAINDSLSLIYDMKKKTNKSYQQVPAYFKGCIEEIMSLFNSVIGHKKTLFEKLLALQTQQVQFVQTLLGRISEFDVGLSSFHGSAENIKGETKKLFSVLLSKETEIKKQFDEIQHLKSLLSTNFYENRNNEILSLRKVVSNKDLKVTEKEDLIHNLRSLNYTLRRAKISKSSPSINCSGDIPTDLSGKLQELNEIIFSMKSNLSSILIYLVGNQDKMSQFQETSKTLVQSLAKAHKEIMSYKNLILHGKCDTLGAKSVGVHLNEAVFKVEELLNAVEIFLYDGEKPDLNIISETLHSNMLKLVYVGDLIKKSAEYEHNVLKNMTEENDEIRKQIHSLELQLSELSNLHGADYENENSVIKGLREELEKATRALLTIHQEYNQLKIQKEDMETKNQKVMEELQTKVCTLQEAASKAQSNEPFQKREILFKEALMKKENELNKSNNKVCDLENLVGSLQTKTSELEAEVNNAQRVIQLLKQHYMKCQEKNEQLVERLNEMKNTSLLQNQEFDKLQNELQSLIKESEDNKRSEAVQIANSKKLSQELEALMDEKQNLESNIYSIQDELIKKSEELTILQEICNDHQENLRKFMIENENLKTALGRDEKNRVKLEYEVEKLQEKLKAANERDILINGQLVEKNQFICQLNLDKQKLENYIHDLEIFLRDREDGVNGEHEEIVLRQEETIKMLTARIRKMEECIYERDEFIKLIEKQLEASTQLLEDSDELTPDNQYRQVKQDTSSHAERYKVRLQHAMEQNWKLVTLVHKLQSMYFSMTNNPSKARCTATYYNDSGTTSGLRVTYE